MTDPRFFALVGPLTLGELVERTGAEIAAGHDRHLWLDDVAPLEAAGPRHVGFLDDRQDIEASARSRARAAFVYPEVAATAPHGRAQLLSRQPNKAYDLPAQAFHPPAALPQRIAASAIVDPAPA